MKLGEASGAPVAAVFQSFSGSHHKMGEGGGNSCEHKIYFELTVESVATDVAKNTWVPEL